MLLTTVTPPGLYQAPVVNHWRTWRPPARWRAFRAGRARLSASRPAGSGPHLGTVTVRARSELCVLCACQVVVVRACVSCVCVCVCLRAQIGHMVSQPIDGLPQRRGALADRLVSSAGALRLCGHPTHRAKQWRWA